MIKFLATSPENKLMLGIGLDAINVERLKNNEPIHFFLSALTEDKVEEIFIFYGDTQKEMYEALNDIGVIDENTQIKQAKKTN